GVGGGRQSGRRTRTNPCPAIGTGFTSTATKRSARRLDMGRSISRAIETVQGELFREKRKTLLDKRPLANDFCQKKACHDLWFPAYLALVRRPTIFLALATALLSVTFSAGAHGQGLAPSSLGSDSRSDQATNDVVQVITAKTEPSMSKKTRKLLTKPARPRAEKPIRVAAQKPADTAEKAPSRATLTMDPIRPMNQPT